jgi:hypothetical protein
VSFMAVCWAFAARFTDRCNDQATIPRHRRTLIAMNPRIAPTAMKTVPSGRLLCCMKGAFCVGGTDGATIENAPLNVGKFVGSVGSAPLSVPDDPPVMTGMDSVLVPVDPTPVITTLVVLLPPSVVDCAAPGSVAVVAVLFPSVFVVSVAVDRFGRLVGAAEFCADAPIARIETARAVERSDVFRRSLMMCVLSNYCARR